MLLLPSLHLCEVKLDYDKEFRPQKDEVVVTDLTNEQTMVVKQARFLAS